MLANALVGLVAAIHVYILILEMFMWDTAARPQGIRHHPRVRGRIENARGEPGPLQRLSRRWLIWGLLLGPAGKPVQLFFLGCVIVAGLYGAFTASRKILFIQALPAAVAMAAVLWM